MKRGSFFRIILIGSFLCSFAQAAEYEKVCPFVPAGQTAPPNPYGNFCLSCEKKAGAQSASMSCGQKNMAYCEYKIHCQNLNPMGMGMGMEFNPYSSAYGGMGYGGLDAAKQIAKQTATVPTEWDTVIRCEPNRDGSCPDSKECYTKKNIYPYSLEGQVINDYSKKEGIR